MMILADGQDVADLVPANDRIRLLHLEGSPDIGTKRNFGCRRAMGTIVAHWDDDDWSEPGRLSDQIGRLTETGRAVTGYHSMRFTDGVQWWQYEGVPNYALGTSLCYRLDYWKSHNFPAVQVGEDNRFVADAAACGQLATVDASGLMWATIHPGNTSPRNMGSNWKRIEGEQH